MNNFMISTNKYHNVTLSIHVKTLLKCKFVNDFLHLIKYDSDTLIVSRQWAMFFKVEHYFNNKVLTFLANAQPFF